MPAVLIVSADEDFTSVLAPQIERELSLECAVTADLKAGTPAPEGVRLAVTDGHCKVQGLPVLELSVSHAPFRMAEVLARVRSMLAGAADIIDMGKGYRFFPRERRIAGAGGQAVELTDREMGLLAALLQAGDEGISKDELLRQVWGFEADLNTHTLETHVYRLRSKVREAFGTEMIVAVEGGYRLEI